MTSGTMQTHSSAYDGPMFDPTKPVVVTQMHIDQVLSGLPDWARKSALIRLRILVDRNLLTGDFKIPEC
ncbi:MAG: hypothetical protein PHW36_00645 [Bacilli bacterium]|nr:hypothetical protein [Bacilli bacterium]